MSGRLWTKLPSSAGPVAGGGRPVEDLRNDVETDGHRLSVCK